MYGFIEKYTILAKFASLGG